MKTNVVYKNLVDGKNGETLFSISGLKTESTSRVDKANQLFDNLMSKFKNSIK